MSLAINSLILFFLLIVPGIVFRRFYYTNEFSKQFILKDPFQSFVSNIIPGILIQFGALVVFHSFYHQIDIDGFLDLFYPLELIEGNKQPLLGVRVRNLLTYRNLWILSQYLIFLTFLSITLAWIARLIVRKNKLDIHFKILRFQNEWHYLFKGEIKDFKSFNGKINHDIDTTYVDVLTNHEDDKAKFYTGLLTDYTLDANTRQLENIYITNVKRYDSTKEKNKKFITIPGQVFVIPYKTVRNLNLRYQGVVRSRNFKKRNSIFFIILIALSVVAWTFNNFIFPEFFSTFKFLIIEKILMQLLLISAYTIFYTVHIHNKKSQNSKVKINIGSYKKLFYLILKTLIILGVIHLVISRFI